MSITQKHCDSVAGKLTQFYDSLPAEEKPILDRLLNLAAGAPEVAGFATHVESNPASKVDQVGEPPDGPCRIALDQGAIFSFPRPVDQTRGIK